MANVHVQNKTTGELREVDPTSVEFKELAAEVTTNGLAKWEQVEVQTGVVDDDPLGLDAEEPQEPRHQALVLNDQGVAPEINPHLQLTPGEVEAGLTPLQKLKDLEEMFATRAMDTRDDIVNSVTDIIAGERQRQEAAQQARGLRARAGGSDDREGSPVVTATDEPPREPAGKSTGGDK